MSTGRLETFADGVFAITATLLILNVDGAVSRPAYVAYAVSFLTIGIIWVNHHTAMSLIERADRRFLLANAVFLMCVAFIPFPTRLLAEHLREDGAKPLRSRTASRSRRPRSCSASSGSTRRSAAGSCGQTRTHAS